MFICSLRNQLQYEIRCTRFIGCVWFSFSLLCNFYCHFVNSCLRNMSLICFNRYVNIAVILFHKIHIILGKSSLCCVRYRRYDLNSLKLIELSSIISMNNWFRHFRFINSKPQKSSRST